MDDVALLRSSSNSDANAFTPQRFLRVAAPRLGIDHLDIDLTHREWPGGDADNDAHVHAEDDLRYFEIEYRSAEGTTDNRRALLHELLHVAFRHVAAIVKGAPDAATRAWLTQAIEEDTEALAEALEPWIDQ